MPGSTGPNIGLVWGFAEGEDGWGYNGYNPGFERLDSLIHLSVLGISDTPPGSPADGERYIVGGSPSGAWSGQAGKVAAWLTIGGAAWHFYAPKVGWRAHNVTNGLPYLFDGSAWLSDALYSIGSSSDPTALLTADQDLLYHRVADDITFPGNFGAYRGLSSKAGGTADATADTTIWVQRAATGAPNTFATVGSITIAAGGVNPVLNTAGGGAAQNFNEGDVLRLRAQTTPDVSFKGFYSTLIAYRR